MEQTCRELGRERKKVDTKIAYIGNNFNTVKMRDKSETDMNYGSFGLIVFLNILCGFLQLGIT